MKRMTQWMAWALLTTSAPAIACATAHAQSAADKEDVITILGARQAYLGDFNPLETPAAD